MTNDPDELGFEALFARRVITVVTAKHPPRRDRRTDTIRVPSRILQRDIDPDCPPAGVTVADEDGAVVIRSKVLLDNRQLAWVCVRSIFFLVWFLIFGGGMALWAIRGGAPGRGSAAPCCAVPIVLFLTIMFAAALLDTVFLFRGRYEVRVGKGRLSVFTGFQKLGRRRSCELDKVEDVLIESKYLGRGRAPYYVKLLGTRIMFGQYLPWDQLSFVAAAMCTAIESRRGDLTS